MNWFLTTRPAFSRNGLSDARQILKKFPALARSSFATGHPLPADSMSGRTRNAFRAGLARAVSPSYHLPPMPRWVRYSLFPAAIAFSALFIVLPQTGADATIKITGSAASPTFSPSVRSVGPGARVAFENDTRATQTATCLSCAERTSWDSGDIQPGQTAFVTLPAVRGEFEYGSRYDQQLTGRLLAGVSSEASPSPSASGS